MYLRYTELKVAQQKKKQKNDRDCDNDNIPMLVQYSRRAYFIAAKLNGVVKIKFTIFPMYAIPICIELDTKTFPFFAIV